MFGDFGSQLRLRCVPIVARRLAEISSGFSDGTRDFGALPPGSRSLTLLQFLSAVQSLTLTLCCYTLAFIRARLTFVGHLLAIICDPVPLISDAIAIICDPLAS